jgi:hypothetical protein
MHNYAFAPDVALRVRQLAEVVDQAGNLMPSYALNENGCITDART